MACALQFPVAAVEVTVNKRDPSAPDPSYTIGIVIDEVEGIKVVVNVPEKPPPETVTVTEPGFVTLIGIVSVPVCPATPLDTKLPKTVEPLHPKL